MGLLLSGRYPCKKDDRADHWLARVEAWLERAENEPLILAEASPNPQGQPTLFWEIHPCAEEVELTVVGPGRVYLAGKSSTVGPGYHDFLCELVHKLTREFHIDWDPPQPAMGLSDDSRHFDEPDIDKLQIAMLSWLGTLCRAVLSNLAQQGKHLMIALPMDRHFQYPNGVLTPLGPRPLAWFQQTAEDPRRGRDFFAWWEPGTNAEFYLGRALGRMWQDLPWRPPITEDETETLQCIHRDLERAYRRDEHVGIPWREWNEIVGYLKESQGYVEFFEGCDLQHEIAKKAARCHTPVIGYRRYPMRVYLTGGWSLEVPGHFAERWENDGENWVCWFEERSIWFTSLSFQKQDETVPDPAEILEEFPLPDGEPVALECTGAVGNAVVGVFEEEGENQLQLQGRAAIPGGVALVNVSFADERDREWAVATWRSLQHTAE